MAICDPRLKSPGPKDDLCQISMHSGQWFMRRSFCYLKRYKMLSPKGMTVYDSRDFI